MVLKSAFAVALCTGLLMSGSTALADDYKAGELIGLDLSQAVLSPKRLGPETRFAPVRIEARNDARPVKTERVVVPKEAAPKPQVAPQVAAHVAHERAEKPRVEKPRGAARTKLARRHTNPLDAQARDTRIQTWPCKSGGICGWQR
ncbi:hypothetical protein V1294_006405 [Bradyrhizobium sp. AZCC 1678]|jgi:hypothetical protein|uniref:hypothetical protein n=1 Tax=Bradyrhizobium sp. AZCC 1678 TaxID=3117030 RepID=UPI002FF39548